MMTVNNLVSTVRLTSNNENNYKKKECKVSFQGSFDEFVSNEPKKKEGFLQN